MISRYFRSTVVLLSSQGSYAMRERPARRLRQLQSPVFGLIHSGSDLLHHRLDLLPLRIIGIRCQQLLPQHQGGLAIMLTLPLHHTHVEQRLRIVGRKLQRLFILADRPVGVARVPNGGAHVSADIHIRRQQIERPLAVLNRLCIVPGVVVMIANVCQQYRIVGPAVQLLQQWLN